MDRSKALDIILNALKPALDQVKAAGFTVKDFDVVVCDPVQIDDAVPTPETAPVQEHQSDVYTGYVCLACGSNRTIWKGSCRICLECGETNSCG